jgi:hypothetical protein
VFKKCISNSIDGRADGIMWEEVKGADDCSNNKSKSADDNDSYRGLIYAAWHYVRVVTESKLFSTACCLFVPV